MTVPLVNLKAALAATESDWRARVDALVARGQFILGPELASFEQEFAHFLNAPFSVGVGSGSAALELCLRDAGIRSADRQVITTPLTAPFTGIAILSAGASIRFADIDPETLLIDPAAVAGSIHSSTAAIVPVHLYGQPCHLERLAALGLPLIQDACQAHGATFRGRPFTEFSPYVAYSFYPTKNLGCLGDGGAIATGDPEIARRLFMLRDGGRAGGQVSLLPGINARLDDIQCCFLRAFLPHLTQWNAERSRIAALYDQAFQDFEPVRPIIRRESSVHHLYVVRAHRRDELRIALEAQGIGTGIHYPVPLHLHPSFENSKTKPGSFPHAELACQEIVSLPVWPGLRESQVHYCIDRIRAFY